MTEAAPSTADDGKVDSDFEQGATGPYPVCEQRREVLTVIFGLVSQATWRLPENILKFSCFCNVD